MPIQQTRQYVSYKGRTYILHVTTPSKFGPGNRSKLSFLDGSKEFWVDTALTSSSSAPAPSSASRGQRGRCENCNERAHCCTRPGCNCGGYDCLS